MKVSALLSTLAVASVASAIPAPAAALAAVPSPSDVNPWEGRVFYVNPTYAEKLKQTVWSFVLKLDFLNAARTRTVQKTSTFVWITTVAGLSDIDVAIKQARKVQKSTKKPQIVGLVLYDLPSRDCSAGESAGEFQVDKNGLALYKSKFIDPYAAKVKAASDLSFAIVLEPDSLGNLVTNMGVPLCAQAADAYTQGIAYAIAKLQAPNIALYVDAAHGGWLGWDGNLPLAAAEFSKVVTLAKTLNPASKIRGFSTDVSNYNPYIANPRANYTQYSNSYDELHYAQSLAPFLTNASLPTHFIIDQGRSGLQNSRAEWGDWCNVKAGYGVIPTSKTNSTLVDSLVWIKPAGESDGACGPLIDGEGAPNSGQWWNKYAMQTVKNANPPLKPTWF